LCENAAARKIDSTNLFSDRNFGNEKFLSALDLKPI